MERFNSFYFQIPEEESLVESQILSEKLFKTRFPLNTLKKLFGKTTNIDARDYDTTSEVAEKTFWDLHDVLIAKHQQSGKEKKKYYINKMFQAKVRPQHHHDSFADDLDDQEYGLVMQTNKKGNVVFYQFKDDDGDFRYYVGADGKGIAFFNATPKQGGVGIPFNAYLKRTSGMPSTIIKGQELEKLAKGEKKKTASKYNIVTIDKSEYEKLIPKESESIEGEILSEEGRALRYDDEKGWIKHETGRKVTPKPEDFAVDDKGNDDKKLQVKLDRATGKKLAGKKISPEKRKEVAAKKKTKETPVAKKEEPKKAEPKKEKPATEEGGRALAYNSEDDTWYEIKKGKANKENAVEPREGDYAATKTGKKLPMLQPTLDKAIEKATGKAPEKKEPEKKEIIFKSESPARFSQIEKSDYEKIKTQAKNLKNIVAKDEMAMDGKGFEPYILYRIQDDDKVGAFAVTYNLTDKKYYLLYDDLGMKILQQNNLIAKPETSTELPKKVDDLGDEKDIEAAEKFLDKQDPIPDDDNAGELKAKLSKAGELKFDKKLTPHKNVKKGWQFTVSDGKNIMIYQNQKGEYRLAFDKELKKLLVQLGIVDSTDVEALA